MHILAVDVGNSRTKWGLWDGRWLRQDSVLNGGVGACSACASGRTADTAAADRLQRGGQAGRDWLEAWALSQGLSVPLVISQREQCGVRNGYREPTQSSGADRWAALIARATPGSRCGAGGHGRYCADDRRADAGRAISRRIDLAGPRPDGRVAGARYSGVAARRPAEFALFPAGPPRTPSRAAPFRPCAGP